MSNGANNFFKWWTIANTVWGIVNNFVSAGGPSPNATVVANEASKEIERKVFSGMLPPDILDGKDENIQTALLYHPAIPNPPTLPKPVTNENIAEASKQP